MSDILIKGMEMPKNCGQCQFFAWSLGVGQHCAVDSEITFHATIDGMDVAYERNGNCPLVSVPPHGRLIDADALDTEILQAGFSYALTRRKLRYTPGDVRQKIANAPTIIPAEEDEA